jgi:Ca2+-binding RTX toxin-like protein
VSPVNDAPTLTAPGTLQIDENGAHAITGVSFADIDAGSSNVTATFQVGSGTLAATSGSGVTVTGSGTGTVTLTGTTAAINAFVAASGVSFTNAHDNVADVTLTARINDGGNTGSGGALSAQTTVTLDIQTHGTLGSASTDNMAGGKGDDLLRGLGGNDTLSGKNGADQLQGGSGHDTLDGGSGNDVIDAGSGYDRLKGGAGNDTFHWGNDALDGATDHVLDFQKGKDKLDFHDIDANPLLAGDQAFTVVSAFGHHAGEMTVVTTKSDTTIQLDVNGDGLADLTIQIHGKVTPSDWIL